MSTINIRQPLFLLLFSMGVLMTEIVLSRIFSVISWYHFGFLILSTAMLGFGIGGLLLRYKPEKLKTLSRDRVAGSASFLCGIFLLSGLYLVTHNPLHISGPGHSALVAAGSLLSDIVLASLILIPPFVLMGAVVLFVLQNEKDRVGLFYGINLTGSALGCPVALVLLNMAGGLNSLIVVASLMMLTGAAMLWPERKSLAVPAGALALMAFFLIPVSETVFPMKSPLGKPAQSVEKDQVRFSEWTSLSRVDFFDEKAWSDKGFGLWGISSAYPGDLPDRMGILIDYWAYTTMIRHKDTEGYYDFLDYLPMYGVYTLKQSPENMLIIGAGGGMDVRAALEHHAGHIDAVEINPSIVKGMTRVFTDESGGVYTDPRVDAHLAEGRRFLESSDASYDVIQLSGVDTISSTQAGAFALSENFLYTKEAFQLYFDHLAAGGILTLTHWYMPGRTGFPRYSMRLFCLAYEALKEDGITSPENHIFYYESKGFTVLLVTLTPFEKPMVQALSDYVDQRGFRVLFRPDKVVFTSMQFYSYVKAEDKAAWLEAYPFKVNPGTDDSPFYFETRKLGDIFFPGKDTAGFSRMDGQTILVLLLGEMVLFSVILLILSYRMDRESPRSAGWLYFFCIGLGFMLAEVSFSQQLVLFLGYPSYALSVVLFAMLIFSGLGSLASRSMARRLPEGAVLILVALVLVGQGIWGLDLIRSLMGITETALRIVIAVLFIALPSFFMGTAFPRGVSVMARSDQRGLGIYWAWNSAGSVSAAILAILIAIESGFSTVMVSAAACYLLSGILLMWQTNVKP